MKDLAGTGVMKMFLVLGLLLFTIIKCEDVSSSTSSDHHSCYYHCDKYLKRLSANDKEGKVLQGTPWCLSPFHNLENGSVEHASAGMDVPASGRKKGYYSRRVDLESKLRKQRR